jgi:uncharacterized membrane protein
MVDRWLFILTLAGALGCALAAGALFAFSSFVMRALMKLPTPTGMKAMQSMNVEAPTPWFMLGLMGPAVVCVVAIVVSVLHSDEGYAGFLIAAAVFYLVGTIGLTAAYHVPRNDALAKVDPESAEGELAWSAYAAPWTKWNHVRVFTGLVASGLYVAALAKACS